MMNTKDDIVIKFSVLVNLMPLLLLTLPFFNKVVKAFVVIGSICI